MKRLLLGLVFTCIMLITGIASAHKPSDSYLTLSVSGAKVEGRWDIAVRDLAYAEDLDADGNGRVTWGEIEDNDVAGRALRRLTIKDCPLTAVGGPEIADHSDGSYVVVRLEGQCAKEMTTLDVDYRLFFDVDPQHRGLLHLEAGESRTHVFSAGAPAARFDLQQHASRHFGRIVKEGIFHIWTGFDHVLFLLALLLPSVLRRKDGVWQPVPALRVALVDVLRIVTAFTLAHSITLSLAALGIVTLPSRLVESAIAASVVLAALNNLYPVLRDDRWVAAFLLGLMHGFGFSATLTDLDLRGSDLIVTLFGFNAGVEIGQVAIVCIFVPLAYAIRQSATYRVGLLRVGSGGIMMLSLVWLAERALAVKILPL